MTPRLLLAALLAFAASPAFAQNDQPKTRASAHRVISISGHVGVYLEKPQNGHEYELRYQLRVQKKGEAGPLLGTKETPTGIAPVVLKGTAKDGPLDLGGWVKLNGKELSGMTGLPDIKDGYGDETVLLRLEPQLYDLTDKKYVTPARPKASVLMANVTHGGQVTSLDTLEDWVEENARTWPTQVVKMLVFLDDYHADGVAEALAIGLEYSSKASTDTLLELEAVLPVVSLAPDKTGNPKFLSLMKKWAEGGNAELKAVAKKRLGQK
jgi:hypothetical protein